MSKKFKFRSFPKLEGVFKFQKIKRISTSEKTQKYFINLNSNQIRPIFNPTYRTDHYFQGSHDKLTLSQCLI